jgi:HD-GYP domain-containing protein (c-di-GMP phosphodiesterase class II)
MKADKSKMFPVSIKNLKAEDGAPFPVFLFLKRNDRFIPIRLPGDPIGLKKYELFQQKQHMELWVPNNFQDIYKSYLEYLGRTGHPVADLDQVMKEVEAEQAMEKGAPAPTAANAEIPKSDEALLVRDVLEDEELSSEEKARVLSAVSQDLLRSLNQITTRGAPARSEGLKRCKEIADEILNVAAQNSNIYDEIMALRNSQEDIEHSVIVGTIAVMFGLAIGLTDEQLLADLTVASIFHDIGLVRVKPEVLSKSEAKWALQERKEYETHVQASIDILKDSGTEFHPRVFRMIAEHHENYDGSGFPNSIRGQQIDELSQLLHLANLFDRLCAGKQTGTSLSPAESFDYIYDVAENPKAVQEVQPELVQRIFQFMLTEKEAAADMQKSAENRVERTLKDNL